MGNPFEAIDSLTDLQDIHGALGKAAASGKLNPDQLASVNNAMSLAQQSLQTRTAASRQLSPSFSGLRPTPLGNSNASGLWPGATGEVMPVKPQSEKAVTDRLPYIQNAGDPTDILGNLRALAKNTFDDLATGRGVMMQAAGQIGADVMEGQVRNPVNPYGHGYIKSPKANPTPEAIGSARAVGEFLGGTAVDPVVYGLGGLAEFGAAAKPLITAGFTGLGAYGTVQAAKQYAEAADHGDRAGKAAAATNVVLNSIMTGLGAWGTAHEIADARAVKTGDALFNTRSSDLMDRAREHAVSQGGNYTPESLQQALGIPYPRALRVAQSLRNDPTTLLDPEGRTVKTEQQVAQTRSGAEPAKIYLARHGTTNFTGEGDADIADGWMESQLTDKGKQEGIQLGRKLRGEGITKVYTSSMQRAKETGYLASSELGVPMETNDNLRPWNLGELQGRTVGEIGDQVKYYQEHPDLTVPGGEPYNTFQQRWQNAFADLTTRAKAGERPLVVTHGRNLEAVSGFLSGKKGEIFGSDDVPKNGEVFSFFDSGQGFKSNTVKGNTDTNVAQLKAKYNIPDVKDAYSGEGQRPPISSSDLLASTARFEAAEKAYKEGLADAFSPKTPAQTTPAEKPVGTGEAAKENSPSEQASKFARLAEAQRGVAEQKMLSIQQHPLSQGVYGYLAEHIGDLTHRMSEHFDSMKGGYEFVKEKVDRADRVLNSPYGFEKELAENRRNNLRVLKEEGRVTSSLEPRMKAYAEAHAHLPVFNEVQTLARDAAVSFGQGNFDLTREKIAALKAYTDQGREVWERKAAETSVPDKSEGITPDYSFKFTQNHLLPGQDESGIDFAEEWAEFPQHTVEAFYQGKSIGGMQLLDIGIPKGRSLRVMESELAGEHRGKGVGSRMYQEAITNARSLGYKYIESDSSVSKEAAAVWKRLGAEEVPTEDGPTFQLKLDKFGPGPGAKTAGPPDIPLRPAEALTESMRGTPSGDKPGISERIATTLDGRYNSLRDFSDKLGRYLKDAPGKLWEKYKQPGYFPPGLKGYGRALGEWHFELTQAAADRRAMLSEMLRVVPDANRRAALSHYIQADGDATTLAKWHGEMANMGHKSTPDYERAMNLTADEQHLARNIRGYFDSQFDEAHKAGMLEHGLQNYFPQMWKPRDAEEMGGRISAAMSHDKLRTNPGFIRQRFYENMFEGEKAGLKPISKDAGFLLGAYDRSMSQAIAARGFIRDLTNLRMADGRMGAWISGVGRKVENFTAEGERAGNRYVINPNVHSSMTIGKDDPLYARRIQEGWEPEEARKVDISDYKGAASRNYGGLNHPSLRDWQWSTKTTEGENVFHQGDLVVHPEIADHLNNVLKTSFLRSSKLGSMALKVSSTLKQSLLIGPFHQVQEGTHGIWHEGVNPFHPADIDLNDALQAHAVRNGLVLDDADNLHQFMEGVQGGGIWGKIPGIGEGLDKYNNYLFHDYIPRLKMNLFKEAYARNLERYGKKWDSDTIAQLTAKQANAAFGGLNYKFMGRSQGMQDALRLGVLAPDFLEARARFMGQAFKPGGREQANAMLVRATMMQYGAARIMNYMLDGDFHWDRPFSVIHKGQEYTMRSVPGDFYHMVSDPQSFVYHRLNPVTGRTVLEAVTGRDEYGRPKDFKHQVADFFKIGVPIPFEGLVNPRDNQTRLESFLDTAMGSAGIARFRYMSNAERLTFKMSNSFASTMLPEDRERYRHLQGLANQLSSGDISEDTILKEASAGTISPNDLKEISSLQNTTPLQRHVSHSVNAEQALDIWKAATPAEKRDLLPIMAKKAGSLYGRYTGKKLTELEQKYDTILNTPVPEQDVK